VSMREMTPREIVQELDKYIVGQDEAKRAVAVALRNRWRRAQVSGDLRKKKKIKKRQKLKIQIKKITKTKDLMRKTK